MEPRPPRDITDVLDRFVRACSADDRIVAAFLGGSHARGEADGYSDVDLCLIATDEAYPAVVADREAIVRRLGEPLFLEHFRAEHHVFFILADGTEGELFIGREGALDELEEPSLLPLLDDRGILERVAFRGSTLDPSDLTAALRGILTGFWHEVSHFITAFGRGQLWWAIGQLEAMRLMCVNLVRIHQGVAPDAEAYFKVDREVAPDALAPLSSTFPSMQELEVLSAARDVVGFFRGLAPVVARERGSTYPAELAELMAERLRSLDGSA